jgi:hypothetical protein
MIRISITAEALAAIAATMAVAVEPETDPKREREIWLEPSVRQ